MGRALPFRFGRTTGDLESPVAAEKPDDSGCKHPPPPGFSPADVPVARRFCLCGCTNVRETERVVLTDAEIHHGFVSKIGDLSEGVGIEVFRLVIG